MTTKTLKNLWIGCSDICTARNKAELKCEAVKIHNAGTLEIMEYLELKDISKREIELLKKFLRKFNNLTEEDLKDE